MESENEMEYDDDPRPLTPGEIQVMREHEYRYDIDIWLISGRTDHFQL